MTLQLFLPKRNGRGHLPTRRMIRSNRNPYSENLRRRSRGFIAIPSILCFLVYLLLCYVFATSGILEEIQVQHHRYNVRKWKEKKMNEAQVLQSNRSRERRKRVRHDMFEHRNGLLEEETHFLTLKLDGTTNSLNWINGIEYENMERTEQDAGKFCGEFAQNAARSYPHLFTNHKKSALNSDSRVFITNILSPLGMNLALKLKSVCGVINIFGSDQMLPNTIENRLEVAKRLKILSQELPSLSHKSLVPQLGITLSNKKMSNIVKSIKPTHIVHLEPMESELMYQATDLGELSYYGDRSPLYSIRQQALGTEKLFSFAQLAANRYHKKPQMVYVSSFDTHENIHVSEQNSVPLSSITDIAGTSTVINEIIAAANASLSKFPSLCIRFPSLIGPWARLDSPLYSIAKDILLGNNLSSTFMNQTSASTDLLYIDDAVDILIASMQLRQDRESISMNVASGYNNLTYHDIARLISQLLAHFKDPTSSFDSLDFGSTLLEKVGMQTETITSVLKWKPTTKMALGFVNFLYFVHSTLGTEKSRSILSSIELNESQVDSDPVTNHLLLCASECTANNDNSYKGCEKSSFDSIVGISNDVTEKCDLLLYTFMHDEGIDSLPLPVGASQFQDTTNGRRICKIAYVPRGSKVVRNMLHFASSNNLNILEVISKEKQLERNDFRSIGDGRLCIGITTFNTFSELAVKLDSCNGDKKQSWWIDSNGRVHSSFDKKLCLDVLSSNGEPGSSIIALECNDLDTQQWEITSDDRVRNIAFSSLYLTASNCILDKSSKLELHKLITEENCSFTQKWAPPVMGQEIKIDDILKNAPDVKYSDKTYDRFNARLVQKGWTLIWYDSIFSPHASHFLLGKLSPGKLFASSVQQALFIDMNRLQTVPVSDDVYFLADMMDRTFGNNAINDNGDGDDESVSKEKGKADRELKYRGIITVSSIHGTGVQIKTPLDMVRYMTNSVQNSHTKKIDVPSQFHFYNEILPYINQHNFRSPNEPHLSISLSHWINPAWIMHDLRSDEAREFRCDWYQEQSLWNSNYDPLGFSYLLSQRKFKNQLQIYKSDNDSVDEVKADEGEWIMMHPPSDSDIHKGYFVHLFEFSTMWNFRLAWNQKHHGAYVMRNLS